VFDRGDLDAGLLLDVLDVHVAPGEARPREVVEEEIGSGLVRLAGPLEIIDLHVIKTGDLAQQSEAVATLPHILHLSLWCFQPRGGDRLDATDLAGDQANGFPVTGELRCLPRFPDAGEA